MLKRKAFVMRIFYYLIFSMILFGCVARADGLVKLEVKKYPEKADELDELRMKLPSMRAKAFKTIRDTLGTEFKDNKTIRFVFTDALNIKYNKYKNYHAIRLSQGKAQKIVFFMEYYFIGQYVMQKKITHELAHAVMRSKMTTQNYKRVPKWVREGFAVFIADQGEARLNYLCANYSEKLSLLVRGLDNSTGQFDEYGEFYLVFKYIKVKYGKQSIGKFIREVITQRGNYEKALKTVTGLGWDVFKKRAKKYAQAEIRKITKKLLSQWKMAFKLYCKKQYSSAEKKFKKLLQNPKSWIYGKTLYYYARSLQNQKKYVEALNSF
ncbi:MAG: hypothetical protein KAJ24_07725, partial [Candidatus Aenigmarchaeota archaeon]|nr:hypothetical protein [Candidatus Aenigmarchaeota archaeon]